MPVKVVIHTVIPKLPIFHTVRPGDKNGIKLKDCFKSCLQNVHTYDVKSIYCILLCS